MYRQTSLFFQPFFYPAPLFTLGHIAASIPLGAAHCLTLHPSTIDDSTTRRPYKNLHNQHSPRRRPMVLSTAEFFILNVVGVSPPPPQAADRAAVTVAAADRATAAAAVAAGDIDDNGGSNDNKWLPTFLVGLLALAAPNSKPQPADRPARSFLTRLPAPALPNICRH